MANARYRPRGDTAANWTAVNPVLAVREIGYELDTKKFKIGDGVTAWSGLAYWDASGSAGVAPGDKGDITVSGGGGWTIDADAKLAFPISTATQAALDNKVPHVADRTALAALSTSIGDVFLKEAGREGMFTWSSANLATAVTNDPNQGIYVPPTGQTGSTGAWVRKYPGFINVKWFGAKGDSNSSGSTGTDDTSAIQAALNFLNWITGGTLFFPPAYYKVTSYCTVPKNVRVLGAGKNASHIVGTHIGGGGANAAENVRNGSIFYSTQPINGSTPTIISIEHIQLKLVSASNVGACWYDSAGSEWSVRHCSLAGGKYGAVLEQSEIAHIDECDIGGQLAGGANIYIPNGSSLTPTASAGFNNVITVKRCQLDGTVGGTTLILHEGGLNFSAEDNNYNGGVHAMDLTNVTGEIRGGEFESFTGDIVTMSGGCILTVTGGSYSASAGHAAFHGGSAPGTLKIDGSLFVGGGGTAPITGTSQFAILYLISYKNGSSSAVIKDGTAGYVDVDLNSANGPTFNGAYFALHNGSGVGGGGLTAPSATITGTTTVENGAGSTATDASVAQIYYGYQQTATYRHALVTKHNTSPTNNGIQLWIHGSTQPSGDLPNILAFELDQGNGVKLFGTTAFNASGVLQAASFPALTGDVTTFAGGLSTTIANNAVSNAKMAQVATATFKGRTTAGTGNPEDLTATQATALLNTFTSALKGLAPASGGGTVNFLRADGTWAAPPGGGGTTTNALTFNTSGGAAPGTTFDGSAARTVDYSSVGAHPVGTLHPGYIAGNWYHPVPYETMSAGAAITAGHISLLPFTLHKPITIAALGTRITTLGTSNCQLAIYAHNAATGRPTGNALVSTPSIVNTATGLVNANVSASATLQPGIYWMAINQNDSTAVYQTLTANASNGGALIGSSTLANINSSSTGGQFRLDVTQAFGTWPSLTSATFTESTSGASAIVFMKAA